MNGLLAGKVKDYMAKQMGGALNGSRPVRIEVVVTQFIVPTGAQRLLIGGAYVITADVTLVDAKSGAVLVALSKIGTLRSRSKAESPAWWRKRSLIPRSACRPTA